MSGTPASEVHDGEANCKPPESGVPAEVRRPDTVDLSATDRPCDYAAPTSCVPVAAALLGPSVRLL